MIKLKDIVGRDLLLALLACLILTGPAFAGETKQVVRLDALVPIDMTAVLDGRTIMLEYDLARRAALGRLPKEVHPGKRVIAVIRTDDDGERLVDLRPAVEMKGDKP